MRVIYTVNEKHWIKDTSRCYCLRCMHNYSKAFTYNITGIAFIGKECEECDTRQTFTSAVYGLYSEGKEPHFE